MIGNYLQYIADYLGVPLTMLGVLGVCFLLILILLCIGGRK